MTKDTINNFNVTVNSLRKIIEYTVVGAHETPVLSKAVNDMINMGWQPYGELVLLKSYAKGIVDPLYYEQVMVKYETNPIKDFVEANK